VVTAWITEAQAERRLATQQQAPPADPAPDVPRLSEEEIIAVVEELGDPVAAQRDAEPEHKLDVYRNLGLTYDPETRTVRAEIDPAAHRWDSVCVRRSTQQNEDRA
jgi:hypothetical protein